MDSIFLKNSAVLKTCLYISNPWHFTEKYSRDESGMLEIGKVMA